MNYLKTSLFFPITVICFTILLLSFFSVTLSVCLGIGLSFWLIMRGRPDGILGLFLLYFSRYYFYYVSSFKNASGGIPLDLRETLTVMGFPLEVETVACGFIFLLVFLEKLLWPKTYRSKFPPILFFLWLTAFLPVLVGFYLGYQMRNPNWTGGLRYLMITGSYFYGYILAKHWPRGRNDLLIPILLPLVVIMLLLMNLGVFWSHHGFLFLGLGGAFSIYFIQKRALKHKLFGVLLLCLSVGYAVIGSITMIGTTFLSILLSYLGTNGKRPNSIIRSRVTKFVGNMAILAILFFTAGVCFMGYQRNFDSSVLHGSYAGTFKERIEAKTLSDRLPLWLSALEQIISGPHFIVPSARPLLGITGFPDGWWNGSHNTILEALRVNGLFAGTVMLIILFLALKNNLLVLTKSADPVLKSLAAAVLGVGIVGMTLNIIPIDMTMGFWLWSLAGLGHGLFLQGNPLSGSRQLHPFRQSQPLAAEGKQQMEA